LRRKAKAGIKGWLYSGIKNQTPTLGGYRLECPRKTSGAITGGIEGSATKEKMTTNQKLLLAVTGGLGVAALNLLRVCVSILIEHYRIKWSAIKSLKKLHAAFDESERKE